jgi:hypothetical protein
LIQAARSRGIISQEPGFSEQNWWTFKGYYACPLPMCVCAFLESSAYLAYHHAIIVRLDYVAQEGNVWFQSHGIFISCFPWLWRGTRSSTHTCTW